jgi:methyl-accepting chemotaxis protein
MGFGAFNVSTRIWIGFGALIAVSLCLAGLGVWQLSGIGGETLKMNALSANFGRVLEVTRRLEAMRRSETRMQIDNTGIDDAKDNQAQVGALLSAAGQATLSEERRQAYAGVQSLLNTHGQSLDHFTQLMKTATDQRAALFTGGDALTAATNKLVSAARETHDGAVAAAAADANSAILLVRVVNWRFMATLDKAGLATFKINHDKAEAALAALGQTANPEVIALVPPVRTALGAYETSFNAFAAARLEASDLYDGTMRPQIKTMQDELDTTAKSIKDAFEASDKESTAIIARASRLEEILAAVALLIGISLALIIGRGITRPLGGMTRAMTKLAGGDRTVEIPARDNTDEIGAMARAVEVFKQDAIAKYDLEEQQTRAQATQSRRQEEIGQLVGFFGRSVSGVFTTLAEASANMTQSSTALEHSASETGAQTSIVLNEVEQTAQTVQTVAAASQELSSSIEEIGRQASESQRISTAAMRQSDEVVAKVAELRGAAEQIGTVVELINSIASQTNLLYRNTCHA